MLSDTTSKDTNGSRVRFRVVFGHIEEVFGDSQLTCNESSVNTYHP
jgi:hypothetical protein